jgi:hypothetical protein
MRHNHPSRSVQMENVQPAENPITKTTIQLSKGLCGKYAVRALYFLQTNLKNVLRTSPPFHHPIKPQNVAKLYSTIVIIIIITNLTGVSSLF